MYDIRIATSDDIEAMAETYIAAFRKVDPSELWTLSAAKHLIAFFLRTQPDLAFVAVREGQVVGGICGLAKPWWDGYHLVQTEIFLAPNIQQQGVGTALFKHFLLAAKCKYNVSQMESITFKDLDFPSSWYLKLGFADKCDWKVVLGDVDNLIKSLNR